MNGEEFGKGFLIFLIVFFGIGGNLLVVAAVWKKRSLRSTTNYLLVNVAVSDITSVVFLPLISVQTYARHVHGAVSDFLCKFVMSYHIPLTASIVSILTLTVLAVERYHAIVKPMNIWIRLRERTVKYAIGLVWLVSMALTSPFYIYGEFGRKNAGKGKSCRYNVSIQIQKIFAVNLTCFVIFIPFIIISFCYFEIVRELYFKKKVRPQNIEAQGDILRKRKLIKLSLSITSAFVLCFFPMGIAVILSVTFYKKNKFGAKFYRYTSVIYFIEAALNPLLYAFQSTNFRRAFKEILKRILRRHT